MNEIKNLHDTKINEEKMAFDITWHFLTYRFCAYNKLYKMYFKAQESKLSKDHNPPSLSKYTNIHKLNAIIFNTWEFIGYWQDSYILPKIFSHLGVMRNKPLIFVNVYFAFRDFLVTYYSSELQTQDQKQKL